MFGGGIKVNILKLNRHLFPGLILGNGPGEIEADRGDGQKGHAYRMN